MHEQVDHWWDGISLRTKVTGVTVVLLTLGLLVSGVGTSWLLRNYLVEQVDGQLYAAAHDPSSTLGSAADPNTTNTQSSGESASAFNWLIYDAAGELLRTNDADGVRDMIGDFTYAETLARSGDVFQVGTGPTSWRVIAV